MAEGHVDVNVTDEVGSTCNVLQFSVWWLEDMRFAIGNGGCELESYKSCPGGNG